MTLFPKDYPAKDAEIARRVRQNRELADRVMPALREVLGGAPSALFGRNPSVQITRLVPQMNVPASAQLSIFGVRGWRAAILQRTGIVEVHQQPYGGCTVKLVFLKPAGVGTVMRNFFENKPALADCKKDGPVINVLAPETGEELTAEECRQQLKERLSHRLLEYVL